MRNKLVIYSGGLDSTILLYQHSESIAGAVHFNYGSHHNNMELAFAELNCKRLNIPLIKLDLREVFSNLSSALLGGVVPHGHYAEDNMAKTVVPFRNGIMLGIATGIADSLKLSNVAIASHKGDTAQYPDCTEGFNLAMSNAMYLGTKSNVELFTPFWNKTKREIVESANYLGINFSRLSYSCYEGGLDHCGRCGTCVERIWALKNTEDLTPYKDKEYAINLLKERGEW